MKKIGTLFIAAMLLTFACNQGTKKADETTDTPEVSMENLVEMTIPVYGMTCEGCENAVKKSVGSLEGIAEVTASHMDSVAVVKFDTALVSLDAIHGKITEAGYTVGN